jgi:hypothetical protein
MFAGKEKMPILNVGGALLGYAPAFTLNHESKLKRLKRDKHSSLLGPSENYCHEKFFNCSFAKKMVLPDPAKKRSWIQCHKTFLRCINVSALKVNVFDSGKNLNPTHGKTLADRKNPGPSFQL